MLRNRNLLWAAFLFYVIIGSFYMLAACTESSEDRKFDEDSESVPFLNLEEEKRLSRETWFSKKYFVAEGYDGSVFGKRRSVVYLQWNTTPYVLPPKQYQVPMCNLNDLKSALEEVLERRRRANSVKNEIKNVKWPIPDLKQVPHWIKRIRDDLIQFLYWQDFFELQDSVRSVGSVDPTVNWLNESLNNLLEERKGSGVFGPRKKELPFFQYQEVPKSIKRNYPRNPYHDIHFTFSYKNRGKWGEKANLKNFNLLKVTFPTYFLNSTLIKAIEATKSRLLKVTRRNLNPLNQVEADIITRNSSKDQKIDDLLLFMKEKPEGAHLKKKLKELGEIIKYVFADYDFRVASYTSVLLEFLIKFCTIVQADRKKLMDQLEE